MPYDKIADAPASLRKHQDIPLTLEQINKLSEILDALEGKEGIENPYAVAWATWGKLYEKSEDGKSWVKIKPKDNMAESYDCECLKCGHKMTSENHCADYTCEKCGGEMRRAERPGVGYEYSASKTKCMDCSKPPEIEVEWADGRARAWFCEPHFIKWLQSEDGDKGMDIVALHKVDGEVSDKWDSSLPNQWESYKKLPSISKILKEQAKNYELSAVAPHDTPKADIELAWDATEAELNIRKWASSDGSGDKDKIDWEKYRQGFAWYNNDDPENLESYKLPHHDIIDNELKVVWKGVAAGMAALLGARGGVDIPDSDKKPVYTHLSGHYEQFEKDIPELSRCDDFFSIATPVFEKLSLAEAERTGQTELLMIDGTAIAEGFWKNTDFSAEVVKDALERAGGLRIDVEHEDETWEDVKGFNYKPRWNDVINGIDVSGAIFDEKVIDWYKRNPDTKIGLSVKLNDQAKFEQINGKKTCTFLDFKGITLTLNPACKVCWLKSAELVELSSSDNESDGVIEMAEKEKTPEELAAEKKLEDEKKLAEEKKIADAKKLEDEKAKKLADEKAEKDKLDKEKEEAATAKPAAADSTLSDEMEKRFSAMQTEIDTLKQANETLGNERSLSETKTMVNGLIESGQLSEAKREGTTKVLMALSSDEDRAAFLNTIGGQKEWEAGEQGLVLSEDKDKDKDKDLEFSEPERRSFT